MAIFAVTARGQHRATGKRLLATFVVLADDHVGACMQVQDAYDWSGAKDMRWTATEQTGPAIVSCISVEGPLVARK